MSRFIYVLIFIGCTCGAWAESFITPLMKVSADCMNYDGKKVLMVGHVFLEHTFGVLQCDKALLLLTQACLPKIDASQEQMPPKKFSPVRIQMEGSVYIVLRDKSTLSSDEADIDCTTLEGIFTAKAPNKVKYTAFMPSGSSQSKVTCLSPQLHIKMTKMGEKNPEYICTDLQGKDGVHIEVEEMEEIK